MKSNKPPHVQAFNRITRILGELPVDDRSRVLQAIVVLFGEAGPELESRIKLLIPHPDDKPETAA